MASARPPSVFEIGSAGHLHPHSTHPSRPPATRFSLYFFLYKPDKSLYISDGCLWSLWTGIIEVTFNKEFYHETQKENHKATLNRSRYSIVCRICDSGSWLHLGIRGSSEAAHADRASFLRWH